MKTDYSYCPLVFNGGSWTAEFNKTMGKIIVSGEKPTFDQFFDCAKHLVAGGFVIEALYIAVCNEFNNRR